ncbi:MAG: T9SS type A sorting domain-containing protein [Ignavibacteriae bacterium]|nr:T9SS type A sorting domain-containing protein [Ignavibacteriota bacterium]
MHKLFTALVFILVLSSHSTLAQTWTQLPTTNNPPVRSNHSAVFDPNGNRMIVFGGKADVASESNIDVNDVWSLDLTTLEWQNITPISDSMPDARFTHNAVFDSAQNQMIIWSGQGAGLYNDVWAFDCSTNTWEELWPNGNGEGIPNQRYGTAAQFDPQGRRLINVSGFTTSGRFPDTWAFHVDTLQWSDRTSAVLQPAKRCLHTSCFAEDRRALYLYAGQTDGIPYLDDLWSLNVDAFEWEQLVASGAPPARNFTSIVYDGDQYLYVFGGQTASGATNDLWQFSLVAESWDAVQPVDSVPSARRGHSAIYVPSRNSMLVFGGVGQNNVRLNDTWEISLSFTTSAPKQTAPAKFQLSQNYPNPFNPLTTIEFEVAEFGFVLLKVFDVLGREIAVVVDEQLSPGTHRRQWDAAGFPSGGYYYRLHAAGAIETKTMVLMK